MLILNIFFSLFPIFTLPYSLRGGCTRPIFCVNWPATYLHATWPAILCFSASEPAMSIGKGLNLPCLFFQTEELTGLFSASQSVFVRHLLLCDLADVLTLRFKSLSSQEEWLMDADNWEILKEPSHKQSARKTRRWWKSFRIKNLQMSETIENRYPKALQSQCS